MFQIKTLSIRKELAFTLSTFTVLVVGATVAPLFHQQEITGPIVNAILFVAVVILGRQAAILVGLMPSLLALSVGLLPFVLAPIIPFIMVSNAILIIIFSNLRTKNYWLALVIASLVKFLFLFSTSSIVINLLVKKELAIRASAMMSWPQLFTALAGGLLAYIFLKIFKKI